MNTLHLDGCDGWFRCFANRFDTLVNYLFFFSRIIISDCVKVGGIRVDGDEGLVYGLDPEIWQWKHFVPEW